MQLDLLAGLTTFQCGQGVAPVSPFRSPASGKVRKTLAIYGPIFDASSPSATLQSSLANRLRARMAAYGSPEYALTWKRWDMQSGPLICALRASARRISDSGFTGWLTPVVNDVTGSQYAYAGGDHSKRVLKLPGAAQTAGWPTPMAGTPAQNGNSEAGNNDSSRKTVALVAGWATPTSRDYKDGASDPTNVTINGLLGRQVSLFSAATEKRGAPNPAFSLWLMGYPTEWARCAALVTRSSRKLRRNS